MGSPRPLERSCSPRGTLPWRRRSSPFAGWSLGRARPSRSPLCCWWSTWRRWPEATGTAAAVLALVAGLLRAAAGTRRSPNPATCCSAAKSPTSTETGRSTPMPCPGPTSTALRLRLAALADPLRARRLDGAHGLRAFRRGLPVPLARREVPRPRCHRPVPRCHGRRDLRGVRRARHLESRLALPRLRRHRTWERPPHVSTRGTPLGTVSGMKNDQGAPGSSLGT